jgi:hypothetical protein
VLFIFTKISTRLPRFLQTAAELAENKERRLFYGAFLEDYLGAADPLQRALFLDHDLKGQSLIGTGQQAAASQRQEFRLARLAPVW